MPEPIASPSVPPNSLCPSRRSSLDFESAVPRMHRPAQRRTFACPSTRRPKRPFATATTELAQSFCAVTLHWASGFAAVEPHPSVPPVLSQRGQINLQNRHPPHRSPRRFGQRATHCGHQSAQRQRSFRYEETKTAVTARTWAWPQPASVASDIDYEGWSLTVGVAASTAAASAPARGGPDADGLAERCFKLSFWA